MIKFISEIWSKNIFKLKLYELGLKLMDAIIVNSLNFKKQLKQNLM